MNSIQEVIERCAYNSSQSTERLIKTIHARICQRVNDDWTAASNGEWTKLQLYEDVIDRSCRILACTLKSQQVCLSPASYARIFLKPNFRLC